VLQPGKIVVLMGVNGAGKSTLLEKIAGLRPPEGLQVSFGPDALWRPKRWRRSRVRLNERALLHYSYASQAPEDALFARSVGEELDYSLRPYRLNAEQKEVRRKEALESAGWESAEWLMRDPYPMSGGERRRTALAATFAAPASWYLLDEPTAGLDGAGHRTLSRQLMKLREEGRGIILISHDSDWALPLADEALLLDASGTLRRCSREHLVRCPEWLEDIGLRVPLWLRTVHRLWRNGVPMEGLWKPRDAAAALMGEPLSTNEDRMGRPAAKQFRSSLAKKREEETKGHRLAGFDPRSIWLAYALVSFGLFVLKDWMGLLLGATVVAALLIAGNVSLLRWRGVIVNYAIFSVIATVLFAAGAGSGWAARGEAFLDTIMPFARTMLILLLGLAIPLVMSPLSLRKALEQVAAIRGRVPGWAQRTILTVTLIMRFVPVLLELWERFVKIFLARGKSVSRNPAALGRRLRDVAIPFLLALFRLGDEVALALESRGVGGRDSVVLPARSRWRRRDYAMVGGGLLLAIALWSFAHR
jgi:energy-coupling factor transport system ATP-binding protein